MGDAKQATPAKELERQIMSSNEPKNEREWWASRRIENLATERDQYKEALRQSVLDASAIALENWQYRKALTALRDDPSVPAYIQTLAYGVLRPSPPSVETKK